MGSPPRYQLRGSTPEDEDGLLHVAGFLNSVNLPNKREAIRELLAASEESFSGQRTDPATRQHVFVLEDSDAGEIIGTSMIIAQKGSREAPYIYFRVKKDEKYSPHLDRHFVHQVLQLGFSYDGPTELGGLVMNPKYRRSPDKLGMMVSYVRFLWIAMNRGAFRDELLAELMPPLEEDGTSHLWEAVGKHFTGLSYQEADKLSKYNKEFIRRLFPAGEICASLLSPDAQAVIGQVGKQTRGVEKLLRRIGFDYVNRVDPFDGGPHFLAKTSDVSLIEGARRVTLATGPNARRDASAKRQLVLVRKDVAPWLSAAAVQVWEDEGTFQVEESVRLALGEGECWALPLR